MGFVFDLQVEPPELCDSDGEMGGGGGDSWNNNITTSDGEIHSPNTSQPLGGMGGPLRSLPHTPGGSTISLKYLPQQPPQMPAQESPLTGQ